LKLQEARPGYVVFQVEGKGAAKAFKHEAGGHRWQRVPPTERKGRVHTSTITVAVLPVPTEAQVLIQPCDLEWATCRGSGAGGQHKNVTDSAVQLKHLPSGITVQCQSERSQHQNKETALAALRAKLHQAAQEAAQGARNNSRRRQLGSGQRADKRRTVRVQAGQVVDHVTGKRMKVRQYLRGELEPLYNK